MFVSLFVALVMFCMSVYTLNMDCIVFAKSFGFESRKKFGLFFGDEMHSLSTIPA